MKRSLDHSLAYPSEKLTLVGGGIIGFLEAYYAYLDAKSRGERIRITIHEKNKFLQDTTTGHIVPSLTIDEILAVVPRGRELIEKLKYLFNERGGIRVDDVPFVNDSPAALKFIAAVQVDGENEEAHRERTEILLALGKLSMELWQELYDQGDEEFKAIMNASNYNPCRPLSDPEHPRLHDGFRIDLIHKIPNAQDKAMAMQSDYLRMGYHDCKILSPKEAEDIDPALAGFCQDNSEFDVNGSLVWKNDATALWRPGGCIDTQVFLPKLRDYLAKNLGQYTNADGVEKDCFRIKFDKKLEEVKYRDERSSSLPKHMNGLKFFEKEAVKYDKHRYERSDYVICPGEAVGTLDNLGFAEPAYARFAGPSLMLRIHLSADDLVNYANLNHCMEVHQKGVVLAWQAHMVENTHQIFIGVAGTKAFYGNVEPNKDDAFAKDRNLLQLNMVNEVLPDLISRALSKDTKGMVLTQEDLDELERLGIADRWVGSRGVAFDGFPTVGPLHSVEHGLIANARTTTHAGSGGVSFGPVLVKLSRSTLFASSLPQELKEKAIAFADPQRVAAAPC